MTFIFNISCEDIYNRCSPFLQTIISRRRFDCFFFVIILLLLPDFVIRNVSGTFSYYFKWFCEIFYGVLCSGCKKLLFVYISNHLFGLLLFDIDDFVNNIWKFMSYKISFAINTFRAFFFSKVPSGLPPKDDPLPTNGDPGSLTAALDTLLNHIRNNIRTFLSNAHRHGIEVDDDLRGLVMTIVDDLWVFFFMHDQQVFFLFMKMVRIILLKWKHFWIPGLLAISKTGSASWISD